MEITQEKNLSMQKQDCKLNAISVQHYFGKVNQSHPRIKDIFALLDVTQTIVEILCLKMNSLLGRVELLHTKLIGDGLKKIQRKWLILKQEDMQDKEMQKVHTLSMNGENFVRKIIGDVLIVINVRNLQKTTFIHYQKVGQIIYQTFNPYAVLATVENGNLSTKTQSYLNGIVKGEI